MYDIIIVGMGPAGITAAIYAKRNNAKVLVLEKGTPGGLVSKTIVVENYPGEASIKGSDLAMKMFKHFNSYNIEYKIEEVLDITPDKEVITNKGKYHARSIILAIGRKNRKLAIPDFDKYLGRGISYCATCDGHLYKNEEVVVVGSGNSAFEESAYLSNICKQVIILTKEKIKAETHLIEQINNINNVKVKKGKYIKNLICDSDKIVGIKLDDDSVINCKAIFVYTGFEKNNDCIMSLKILDQNAQVILNENLETKIPGIFVCGDAAPKSLYQIVTAVSDGAIAATNALKYLDN